MIQKNITKFLLLTIAFTFALSINYIFAAWTGPIQAPPGGNTPTPVHIGTTNQVKDGGLGLNALSVFGNGYFQDNVGIGTVSPSTGGEQDLKLDVEGAIGAKYYCDENGNNCSSAPFGGAGVDKIIAGSGITISPSSGIGNVIVSGHGDGFNCSSGQAAGGVDANGNAQNCISVPPPAAGICTNNNRTYSTGYKCSKTNMWTGGSVNWWKSCNNFKCNTDGSWTSGTNYIVTSGSGAGDCNYSPCPNGF